MFAKNSGTEVRIGGKGDHKQQISRMYPESQSTKTFLREQ